MALPDTNTQSNRFYWTNKFTPTAGAIPRKIVLPFPCRIRRYYLISPGASGGGTDFVMLTTISGSAVGVVTFATAGSAEGVIESTPTSAEQIAISEGGWFGLSFASGAWTTTTPVAVMVEFEADA